MSIGKSIKTILITKILLLSGNSFAHNIETSLIEKNQLNENNGLKEGTGTCLQDKISNRINIPELKAGTGTCILEASDDGESNLSNIKEYLNTLDPQEKERQADEIMKILKSNE